MTFDSKISKAWKALSRDSKSKAVCGESHSLHNRYGGIRRQTADGLELHCGHAQDRHLTRHSEDWCVGVTTAQKYAATYSADPDCVAHLPATDEQAAHDLYQYFIMRGFGNGEVKLGIRLCFDQRLSCFMRSDHTIKLSRICFLSSSVARKAANP